MKICIFGMGYVGCITSVGFASLSHEIIGVEIDKKKVELINRGLNPIVEKDMDRYLKSAIENKRLIATTNSEKSVLDSDISIVCVGTPSQEDGSLDLSHTLKVCENIGNALKKREDYHLVVFKSTMLPGSVENSLLPIIEKYSGKGAGKDFGVCHNPEFLREGSGVYDFFHPPVTVIGQLDDRSGLLLRELYKDIETSIVHTSIKIAEMIKYVNNSFHALKVTFANEMGNICKKEDIDAHELMKIFFMDKELNISTAYLKPGVPFGGSCLTKDLDALRVEAKKLDLKTPLLDSIKESNEYHLNICTKIIEDSANGRKNIGILGVSFKEGTDDLRSSIMIRVIDRLVKKGFNLRVYDRNVLTSEKFGENRIIIEKEFPYLSKLFCQDIKEVIDSSDVIVVKNRDEEFKEITKLITKKQKIIDLVRLFEPGEIKNCEGISW